MTDHNQQPVPQSGGETPQPETELERTLEAVEAATARTAAVVRDAAAAVQDAAAAARERAGLPDAAQTQFNAPDHNASAVQTLQSIDFNSMIGGPLLAGVNATAQAAVATAQYIQTVGFTGTAPNYQVNTIKFSYTTVPAGEANPVTNSVIVPLLSIIPIPYLRVDSMDIEFKAQINSMQSVTNTNTFGVTTTTEGGTGGFLSLFQSVKFSVSVADTNVNTAVSQQTSNYSMDVRVHAGVDPIPAGMQRVLNIFESVILPQPATA